MAFIETIDEDAADGALAELYAGARDSEGYVPNTLRAFSERPEVWAAWVQLKNTTSARRSMRSVRCRMPTTQSWIPACATH